MKLHANNTMGLYPDWLMTQDAGKKTINIESLVYFYPFSRDIHSYQRLSKQLAGYRLAFGQPNQKEFMEYINSAVEDSQELREKSSKYAIDIRPR